MSFGGGYQGGRTKMGTKVILNIYDLSPINDYLYTIGFGLHHTGVEIQGSEYSFAGGGGIFSSTPKDAPGAIFRESIEMGVFEGSNSDIQSTIDDLRNDFGPNVYNLVFKNCNHFANAFCWALLRKPIPSYCNRLADYGACLSCFIPRKMLENAPVGPNDGSAGGEGGSTGFQVFPGRQQGGGAKPVSSTPVFSGSGAKLGGTEENASSSLFGSLVGKSSDSNKNSEDLTDRREKARKAALARLERSSDASASIVTTATGNNGLVSLTPSHGKSS